MPRKILLITIYIRFITFILYRFYTKKSIQRRKEEIFDFIKQYAGNDSEAYIKLYEECEEKYLVNNVEKEIIGIFFGKKDLLYGKDAVFIELFIL